MRCLPVETEWVMDAVELRAAPAEAEVAWSAGALATGIAGLDDLLAAAGLDEVTPVANDFVARFDRFVNPGQVLGALDQVDGVMARTIGNTSASGDVLIDGPDDPTITMIYAFGDCYVGCGYAHTWEFETSGGRAELLAESGDELPPLFDECVEWRVPDPLD